MTPLPPPPRRRRDARAALRRVFDSFDSTSDLVALSVSAPTLPTPASSVQPPSGVTSFSIRAHESALAYKPPLPKKESLRFEAPKIDPLALPSVGMEARLQQVCESTLYLLGRWRSLLYSCKEPNRTQTKSEPKLHVHQRGV